MDSSLCSAGGINVCGMGPQVDHRVQRDLPCGPELLMITDLFLGHSKSGLCWNEFALTL